MAHNHIFTHMKELLRQHLNESHADYLKWKRNNVTLRGMKDRYAPDNGNVGRFGPGLYTAALSNMKMAREYGEVRYLLNARPKKPKIVKNTNQAEMFIQNIINRYCQDNGHQYNPTFFYENTTIQQEVMKLGYDGIIISGREMVNYDPPSNIKYFDTERQLYMYYNDFVANQ